MPHLEPAQPLHATMVEMIHEARRRGMSHDKHSLPVCALLLEVHTPAGTMVGGPCAGCSESWPCPTVLGILGGLGPASARQEAPGSHDAVGGAS